MQVSLTTISFRLLPRHSSMIMQYYYSHLIIETELRGTTTSLVILVHRNVLIKFMRSGEQFASVSSVRQD